nr:alpha/beta fold hydrolase [Amylibacter sp.]
MLLNSYSFGEETGTPLLIVHGLFGSARNWHSLARNFARDRWVVSVDLRNHGNSFWEDTNSYHDMAEDLAKVIKSNGGKADVIGHSMGGKAAMTLATTTPELLDRLIIADIAPVTYAHSQSDKIAIMKNLPLDDISRKSEAQKWLQEATGDAALASFFSQSLEIDDGKARWVLNLDVLATYMDQIIGFPDLEGHFERSVLALRGGASDYVTESGLNKMTKMFPNLTVETIPDAGHWLHAEKPKEFVSTVKQFLELTQP